MPARSILLGSNGYLGRHLALQLEAEGFSNSCFDIQPESHAGIGGYQPLDLTDRVALECLDSEVDYIFVFAGLTGTAEGFANYRKFIEVNEIGLLNLLSWMKETGCRARVVFPSTRLVYKGMDGRALKEEDPFEAKTIYAINKLAAERMLWMHHNAFGIDYTVFRICVPYGNMLGGEVSYGTLGFFLGQAKAGQDITLFGDGEIWRSFTHVSDISRLVVKAIRLEETKNGIFNIGGEALSLLDVAGQVARKYGVGVRLVDWPEMALRLESGSTVFDDSKLLEICPYTSGQTLGTWLKELDGSDEKSSDIGTAP